jgi:hypothetical protein
LRFFLCAEVNVSLTASMELARRPSSIVVCGAGRSVLSGADALRPEDAMTQMDAVIAIRNGFALRMCFSQAADSIH